MIGQSVYDTLLGILTEIQAAEGVAPRIEFSLGPYQDLHVHICAGGKRGRWAVSDLSIRECIAGADEMLCFKLQSYKKEWDRG